MVIHQRVMFLNIELDPRETNVALLDLFMRYYLEYSHHASPPLRTPHKIIVKVMTVQLKVRQTIFGGSALRGWYLSNKMLGNTIIWQQFLYKVLCYFWEQSYKVKWRLVRVNWKYKSSFLTRPKTVTILKAAGFGPSFQWNQNVSDSVRQNKSVWVLWCQEKKKKTHSFVTWIKRSLQEQKNRLRVQNFLLVIGRSSWL